MRTITTHHTNDANRKLELTADERDADNGNSSHAYTIDCVGGAPDSGGWEQRLSFQRGPIKENGINGITNEVLLAIVIDRLEGFQSSKWACQENEQALSSCKEALGWLESRTKARQQRGVEGTHEL